MFKPVQVIDLEIGTPLSAVAALDGYDRLQALVRLWGRPLGALSLHPLGGHCAPADVWRAIITHHSPALLRQLVRSALAGPVSDRFNLTAARHRRSGSAAARPPVTVAVCTRDRTAGLARCLSSLAALDYPALDLLVVDNAPTNDATAQLLMRRFPNVRYVCEPRPGLDWARNRAIAEAHGDIIAFTDDDAVADSQWVSALAEVFASTPEVMAVTGLVVPYQLDTEAQLLFERYGGFGRGCARRWFVPASGSRRPLERRYRGAGMFGTGANMAFRRVLFDRIGGFEPALDVGTVTNGGGDLEMFFRVLKEGHTLVYEPAAIVRHQHRREYRQLRAQMRDHGIGLYAYFARSALAYREERAGFLWLGLWWLWWWSGLRLLRSLLNPAAFPRDLIVIELWGSLLGALRYRRARRIAADIARQHGQALPPRPPAARVNAHARSLPTAMRVVELSEPLPEWTDLAGHERVRAVVTWHGAPVGSVELANGGRPVRALQLGDVIADELYDRLLEVPTSSTDLGASRARALLALTPPAASSPAAPPALPAQLPAEESVSIVIATRDRPDDLRQCLETLIARVVPRSVEIVVVDNHPGSGLTPPVVAEFAGVVLVNEPRQGLARARNAGIASCSGDIVVSIDDDVRVPEGWLEKLLAPFVRRDVMIVTGNVLPLELETAAQRLFELYGGLGRGFQRLEADGDWFRRFSWRAVPTWLLGATANAAFRASLFSDPAVGLLDEALGAGTPTGCSEDTYLFYKALRAEHTIVYEPAAYVWHKHRRELRSLWRQIYNYSKGHVAYHLTTLLRDHDLRALVRLTLELPWAYLCRLRQALRCRNRDLLLLTAPELLGHLAGPFALWRSRRQVAREQRELVPATAPAADSAPFNGQRAPLPQLTGTELHPPLPQADKVRHELRIASP
ncbi:MAG: glycosyltransferase [Deltaproteobacteria bacterium]|nr:glycosyltransferase [Deltaproteobacteria bacterium]